MTRPKKKSILEKIFGKYFFQHTFLNHSRLDVSPKKPLRAILRDGPIENLWGEGGGGKLEKEYSRKGKLNEKKKNHARQLTLKNIHAMGLKKIHTKYLIPKKNSCGSKIPLPSPP